MAKTGLLNVRKHLEHVQLILDALFDEGYSPALLHEVRIARLLNQQILKKHVKKKTRKDIYIETA